MAKHAGRSRTSAMVIRLLEDTAHGGDSKTSYIQATTRETLCTVSAQSVQESDQYAQPMMRMLTDYHMQLP